MICNMTAEECDLELTMYEVKKLFQKARKAQVAAQTLENAVYQAMEDMCIDVNSPTEAHNAVNFKDVIHKHLHSGDYSLREIMKEVRMWYTSNNGN